MAGAESPLIPNRLCTRRPRCRKVCGVFALRCASLASHDHSGNRRLATETLLVRGGAPATAAKVPRGALFCNDDRCTYHNDNTTKESLTLALWERTGAVLWPGRCFSFRQFALDNDVDEGLAIQRHSGAVIVGEAKLFLT